MRTGLPNNIDTGAVVRVHSGFEGVHLLCDPYLTLAINLLLNILQLLCQNDNCFLEGIIGCGENYDITREIPLASHDDSFITGAF